MTASNDSPGRNEMKSFRLYIPKPKVSLADGSETEYSPNEIAILREKFRPVAAKYRRCLRVQIELFGLFVMSVVCMLLFLAKWAMYLAAASFIGLVVFGWSCILFSKLRCPACQQDLGHELGQFCPECGHAGGMRPADWFRAAKCEVCGMSLRYHKGQRTFKIRACTHCGLPLDDEGV